MKNDRMMMDANTRFEIIAMAFHGMTGMLAPGKDSREAYPSYEERQEKWISWNLENRKIIEALLRAVDEICSL